MNGITVLFVVYPAAILIILAVSALIVNVVWEKKMAEIRRENRAINRPEVRQKGLTL